MIPTAAPTGNAGLELPEDAATGLTAVAGGLVAEFDVDVGVLVGVLTEISDMLDVLEVGSGMFGAGVTTQSGDPGPTCITLAV
jgi:hypothetical protein